MKEGKILVKGRVKECHAFLLSLGYKDTLPYTTYLDKKILAFYGDSQGMIGWGMTMALFKDYKAYEELTIPEQPLKNLYDC